MVGFLSRQYATATSPDAVERFVTSWLLPPSVLFVWRALISFYAFIVIFIVLGHDSSRAAGRSFSYFTVLGYWGLAFYFGVSAAHTWAYRRHGKAWLQNWPSWLQYAHSVFYSTVTTFPPVVTIVFWSVLSYGALSSEFTTWANISQHGLNSAFAVSEVIISRANPSPWINLVPVLVLLGCYLAVAEITHATEGWYVYIFLDPSWLGSGVVVGACFIILVGTTFIFVVFRYIGVLRKWITEGKCGKMGKFSQKNVYSAHESYPEDANVVPMHVRSGKGGFEEQV